MDRIIAFAIPIMHNQSHWMDNKNTPNSNVNTVSATPGQCNNSDTDDYNIEELVCKFIYAFGREHAAGYYFANLNET